jgi:Fe-S-cluster containining protein
MDCTRCGACCVAPDIAALDKPVGVRCPNLGPDLLCNVYERRPAICRSYRADWLCEAIAAPTLEERVANYHRIFGLADEAEGVRRAGFRSMREARAAACGRCGGGGSDRAKAR